jgi:cell division protein FtsW (lipid II flippase)
VEEVVPLVLVEVLPVMVVLVVAVVVQQNQVHQTMVQVAMELTLVLHQAVRWVAVVVQTLVVVAAVVISMVDLLVVMEVRADRVISFLDMNKTVTQTLIQESLSLQHRVYFKFQVELLSSII